MSYREYEWFYKYLFDKYFEYCEEKWSYPVDQEEWFNKWFKKQWFSIIEELEKKQEMLYIIEIALKIANTYIIREDNNLFQDIDTYNNMKILKWKIERLSSEKYNEDYPEYWQPR